MQLATRSLPEYNSQILQIVQLDQPIECVEVEMPKTISSSELRAQIKRILNEVGYGQSQYVVERFGEPTAAIVSMEDLRLLQAVKQRRAKTSLRETITTIRRRGSEIEADELDALIEEARSEFYELERQTANA